MVNVEMIEYRSASSAVPSMAWAVSGLMSPSRPVVRPDCSHTLLMSHMSQQSLSYLARPADAPILQTHNTLRTHIWSAHPPSTFVLALTLNTIRITCLLNHNKRSSNSRRARSAWKPLFDSVGVDVRCSDSKRSSLLLHCWVRSL